MDDQHQHDVDARTAIQRRMIDGRIRPGERLVEQRLAEDLGISRTPVREALIALRALGQVSHTRGGWEMTRHSPEEVRDAFQLRAVLESHAAFQAGLNATTHQQAQIRTAYERMHATIMRDEEDRFEYAHTMAGLNREFHEAIVLASGNARLPGVIQAVVIGPLVFSAFAWYTEPQRARSDELHRAICEAISRRDARRAEWLMAEHIMEGWDVVCGHLTSASTDGDVPDLDHLWLRLRQTRPSGSDAQLRPRRATA